MLNLFAILRNVRDRKKYSNSRIAKAGFTLVELAIVLVIIALVAGGVLVGQDLIKAAEIRGPMRQAEEFKSASKTFTLKYNCLAGDCANATSFLSGTGNGNGDGAIAGGTYPHGSLEGIYFWQHLALAALISGTYSTTPVGSVWKEGVNFPAAKMGGAFGVWNIQTYVGCGGCFFTTQYGNILMLGKTWPDTSSITPLAKLLSGNDAFAIDTKYDDGLPAYGAITTWNMTGPYGYSGYCVVIKNDPTPWIYPKNDPVNSEYSKTTTPKCGLFFANAF